VIPGPSHRRHSPRWLGQGILEATQLVLWNLGLYTENPINPGQRLAGVLDLERGGPAADSVEATDGANENVKLIPQRE
jgi:hypothetical protein